MYNIKRLYVFSLQSVTVTSRDLQLVSVTAKQDSVCVCLESLDGAAISVKEEQQESFPIVYRVANALKTGTWSSVP